MKEIEKFRELVKEFERINKENEMLQDLKKRNVEIANSLKSAGNMLIKFADEIAPSFIKKGTKTKFERSKEIIDECFTKLMAGVVISTKFLMEAYDLPVSSCGYYINKLRRMPNVMERKNGIKIELLRKIDDK